MLLKMKKTVIILTLFVTFFINAQSIIKVKIENDIAVLNFENQTVTWKNSKKTNMILLLEDGFKNGYQWQEYQENSDGNSNHIGTFVFKNKKSNIGYYLIEKTKKKITFTKL